MTVSSEPERGVLPSGGPISPLPFALLLGSVSALLGLVTVAVVVLPGVSFVIVAPELDELLNAAALVIAGVAALLAWARYRETGEGDALFQAAAFSTLLLGAAIGVVLFVIGHDLHASYERANPGQAPMYTWSAQRFVAAVLLLAGAVAALRRSPRPSRAVGLAIVVAPALLVLAIGLLTLVGESLLPVLVDPVTLRQLLMPVSYIRPQDISLPLAVVQLAIAAVYLAGAGAYARLSARTDHRAYTAILSVALVVAAFAQLHYAIVPGSYSELVTSGDVLRLVFYILVVVGVAAATRGDLRALRAANRSLERLRLADTLRATAEERARMAREVHDGLVQELWLARLTGGRLAEMPDLPAEAKEIVSRLDAVLESALGEARQAVVTLQPSPDPSFGALLTRFVEDYADRFGMEVTVTLEGELGALPAEAEGDVLRVCREALTNVRKHANASNADVRLEAHGGVVRLTVTDDGAGFDPRRVGAGGYGLESMRQRATHVGGRLDISSAPGEGTRVTLEVNVPNLPSEDR